MQNRKRDTDVQNRLLDSVGEGEGRMSRKNSMYVIYSERDHQPRWDAWDKCSGLVHREDPEESGGEGGGGGSEWGIHVTPGLIHVNVWQNPLKCCEVISFQLIKINGKKKITSSFPLNIYSKHFFVTIHTFYIICSILNIYHGLINNILLLTSRFLLVFHYDK